MQRFDLRRQIKANTTHIQIERCQTVAALLYHNERKSECLMNANQFLIGDKN